MIEIAVYHRRKLHRDSCVSSNYQWLVHRASLDINSLELNFGKFKAQGKNVVGGYHSRAVGAKLKRKFFEI